MEFEDLGVRIPGEVCGVDNCTSTQWTSNGDGTMSCENGHVRTGFADSDDEPEGDYDPAERGTTTQRKVEKETRESLVYKGRQQKNLFVLCFQLVLRKQLYFLINNKSLPAELEAIVRELWEQRMGKFVGAIDDNFSQTYSSINENEDSKSYGKINLKKPPRMVESIALCFLGTHLLRLPIFLGDFLRWIKSGELIYVNAASHLPNDMRIRLDVSAYWALNTPLAPSLEFLRHTIHTTFRAYAEEFGMSLPPMNLSLCLYRLVKELWMPLEIYSATKKLIELFHTSFEFPKDWSKVFKNTGKTFKMAPDRKLAAYFVIAVKLLYPFDMEPRHPLTKSEPAIAVVDWSLWMELLQEKASRVKKGLRDPPYVTYEDAIQVTERDMLLKNDTQIDQYLNWLAETMALSKEGAMIRQNTFAKELFDMFPIEDSKKEMEESIAPSPQSDTSGSEQKYLEMIQNGLITRQAITPDDGNAKSNTLLWRPGQAYKRYYNVKDLEKDDVAKEFFSTVSDLIGISLEDLTEAVHQLEIQTYKWMIQDRKHKADLMEVD